MSSAAMDFISLVARGLDENGIDPDNIDVKSTNATYIAMARRYCKVDMCPQEWATLQYRPSIAGNAIYGILFAILLAGQLFYGIRKKTWTYMAALSIGIFGEIVGYIGRIMLNKNPFLMDNFLV